MDKMPMVESWQNERRLLRRLRGDTIAPLVLRTEALAAPLQADVRDLTVQGIGLRTGSRIEPGTWLHMMRHESAHPFDPPLMLEVRQATIGEDGTWLIGCKFSRLLKPEDLMQLGRRW